MKDLILFGDCRESLKTIATSDTKARMCVTSPPYYGLRDYGTATWIGGDPNCNHRRDTKVKPENCNTGHKNHDEMSGVGDAIYKTVCPKCGAIRQDSQIGLEQSTPVRGNKLEGLKQKDLIGIPWMLAFALRADGWYLRQDIIWHKPNPMPESVKDRCTKAHEYIFLLSKSKNYYYDNEAIKEPAKDWGTRDRTNGKYHNPGSGLAPHSGLTKSYATKNKRSVWSVTVKPYKGAHFATYPEDLVEPCILAGSEKGDIVLDPFMGSGTTAMVAKKNSRSYLGCELRKEYASLQTARISTIPNKLPLY